jgi:hypothetical protein
VITKQDNHFEGSSMNLQEHTQWRKRLLQWHFYPPHKETTPILLMFKHTLLAVTQIATMTYLRLQTIAVTHNIKFFSVTQKNKPF